MKIKKELLIIFSMFVAQVAFAQPSTQTFLVGTKGEVRFKLDLDKSITKCNIEVEVPGVDAISVEVSPTNLDVSVDYTPQQQGKATIKWAGKTKWRGFNSTAACPGQGVIEVTVLGGNNAVSEKWRRYFDAVSGATADCVRIGMSVRNLRYESADPAAGLISPEDVALKPIYATCDAFFDKGVPRDAVACQLKGVATVCARIYAEPISGGGQVRRITREVAIKNEFENKPWTLSLIEKIETRDARLKEEQETKAKLSAEQTRLAEEQKAKADVEELERKFKASPEYKKQQQELERKRIAEERARAADEKKRIALEAQQKQLEEKKRLADERAREAKSKIDAAAEALRAKESDLRNVPNAISQQKQQKQRLSVSGTQQDELYCGILGFPGTQIADQKCIGLGLEAHRTITKTTYRVNYRFAIRSDDDPNLCKTHDFVKPLLNFLESKNIKYVQTYHFGGCNYQFIINTKQELCSQQARSLLNDVLTSDITALDLTKAGNTNLRKTSSSEDCK